MKAEAAVSELISALLLVAILITASSIVLVILTSQYPPKILPDPRLEIWNKTTQGSDNTPNNTIFIQSTGGDPLYENEYVFRAIPVSGTPYTIYSDSPTVNNTSGNGNLTTGNTINFSVKSTPVISSVQVIYRENGNLHNNSTYEVLLYEKKFLKSTVNSSSSPSPSPNYYYIRLLTSGSGTVIPNGGSTTTLDGFTTVKVPIGTQVSLTATATTGSINFATNRTEFWTADHMNSTEADPISNTIGKTSATFFPPINNNQTVYFSFGMPVSHITIFNLGGGGTVKNGSVTISDGGNYTFTVPSGDPFSAIFSATGSGTISTLRWISGTVTDGNSVISGGADVTNAANNTTFSYLNAAVTQDISIAVVFSPGYKITATTGRGGTISSLGVTTYSAGATPTYTITAAGENRSYQILIDGVPWTDGFNPALRTQTYTFSPLTSSHTIHSRFAIQGVWGNYWGNAIVNGSYNDPNNKRAVGVQSSNPWKPIESTTAWNKQLHHHIQFADLEAMSIAATPAYSTIDSPWPNGANRVVIGSTSAVGSGSSKDYFYVNWSGLMFIKDAGSYRFWIRADDGIKLFIDGVMQSIDARAWIKPYPPDAADWYPCTTNPSVVIPGWHTYTIWYYENAGKAAAELRYQLPGTTSNAYNAEFFTELFYLVD